MKLSTRTRYGMRALVDLALNYNGTPVQLKDIAQRQQLSLSYLEHLIIPLTSAGFIQTIRGSHGGIRLLKLPDQINLKEIVEVLEGPFYPVDCIKEEEHCPRKGMCATQSVWAEIKNEMDRILGSKTLQDLVIDQKSRQSLDTSMYYI